MKFSDNYLLNSLSHEYVPVTKWDTWNETLIARLILLIACIDFHEPFYREDGHGE